MDKLFTANGTDSAFSCKFLSVRCHRLFLYLWFSSSLSLHYLTLIHFPRSLHLYCKKKMHKKGYYAFGTQELLFSCVHAHTTLNTLFISQAFCQCGIIFHTCHCDLCTIFHFHPDLSLMYTSFSGMLYMLQAKLSDVHPNYSSPPLFFHGNMKRKNCSLAQTSWKNENKRCRMYLSMLVVTLHFFFFFFFFPDWWWTNISNIFQVRVSSHMMCTCFSINPQLWGNKYVLMVWPNAPCILVFNPPGTNS